MRRERAKSDENNGVSHVASGKRTAPTTKPITSNPLFPAVVALWVSACCGLGVLAVRPSLLEDLVIKSRIDLIVPAAAPPLGVTARILLALILATLGAILGATVARRLARPKTILTERKRAARSPAAIAEPRVRARDSHPDAPARRPISAHEELGEEMADSARRPGRRRALAIDDEAGPFVLHDVVPLPGGRPQILGHDAPAQDDALDLGEYTERSETPPERVDWNASPADEPQAAAPELPPAAREAEPRQVFHAPAAKPIPAADGDAEVNAMAGRQVFGMAPVEPQDPADRQIFGAGPDQDPADLVRAAGYQASVFEAPASPPLFTGRTGQPSVLQPAEAEPLPAPLASGFADLGMTDLARRLQQAMRQRRAAREAARAEPGSSLAAETEAATPAAAFEPVQAADAEAQPASPPATAFEPVDLSDPAPPLTELEPQPLPAALRPLALDDFDDDDDDDTLASLIPPRHIAMPAPALTAPAAQPDPVAVTENEDSYASLLTLGQPAALRNPFVRIEEPEMAGDEIEPVVIFPGQAPRVPLPTGQAVSAADVAPVISPDQHEASPFRRFDAPSNAGPGVPIDGASVGPVADPEETERALRSALANLQRISGAA
jgi:hypothetical protein